MFARLIYGRGPRVRSFAPKRRVAAIDVRTLDLRARTSGVAAATASLPGKGL